MKPYSTQLCEGLGKPDFMGWDQGVDQVVLGAIPTTAGINCERTSPM